MKTVCELFSKQKKQVHELIESIGNKIAEADEADFKPDQFKEYIDLLGAENPSFVLLKDIIDQIKLVSKTDQNAFVDLSDLDATRKDLYETIVELKWSLTAGVPNKIDILQTFTQKTFVKCKTELESVPAGHNPDLDH